MRSILLICIFAVGAFSGSKGAFAASDYVNQELILVEETSSRLAEETIADYDFPDYQQGSVVDNDHQVILNKEIYKTTQTQTSRYIVYIFPYAFYALFTVGLLLALSLNDTKSSIAKRNSNEQIKSG